MSRWRCTNSMLPGGKKINKGKLRGVESNGMLCSLGELGLTQHDFPNAIEDGIFVLGEDCDHTLGKPIVRGHWLGRHRAWNLKSPPTARTASPCIGLAREAAATFGKCRSWTTPPLSSAAMAMCTPLFGRQN